MRFLPIFFDIKDHRCLVVGAGEVAARKANLLLEAGGQVMVVAPETGDTLRRMIDDGMVSYQATEFTEDLIEGCRLVIAATNDPEVNRSVAQLADAANIPVNVADHPDQGSFIVPSVIDRSPVVVAVSTGGSSPVLARLLRARLESIIPAAYGRLALMVEKYRDQVKSTLKVADRRRFWDNVLQGNIAEMIFSGNEAAAEQALERSIAKGEYKSRGEVYLVGAGPGDPDLLTFRALRLLQLADVVLHDRLVSPEILAMVRKGADLIYVGKEKANHAVPQDQINQLLMQLARQGKRVLRLKGGDPFIFGRGGEEIEGLMREGIPFQVVPGITAAAGCAAYSGIPLTHRDFSQSCVFVTGHLKSGKMDLNWDLLCQPQQTVVVYMGLTGLATLARQMIEHGTPPHMPAALIEKGTTREQRVFTGTLASLPELLKTETISAPTLIIIGEVVTLRDQLNWYQQS
ncbi:MAG: uroporphyrin-III C-methyltransferase/precorrin-2 dehydrogenase/sirohydrochlorin ferrochelatase [Parasphingorhabdus sp.]|jgi:uroporphyrin-III C-methyltransferase/precorrin-2 dehydrogenase/sirohydrochlorin ferrochelatase